ncbi:hypothetical protein PoB_002864700 [Plakobranchus ocellatus]|uniref:Uncharacterized protein n=1 Tax=Plakobranchus ocellatus TaxID=259542 RepID=A0AAV4A5K1_9GAST|nr:hypothetical protein PoB_002864700 [Plakobranchus ocellatus]
MRREGLENLVTTGMLEGKRSRGKQREKLIEGLTDWLKAGKSLEAIEATKDRKKWRTMIANAISLSDKGKRVSGGYLAPPGCDYNDSQLASKSATVLWYELEPDYPWDVENLTPHRISPTLLECARTLRAQFCLVRLSLALSVNLLETKTSFDLRFLG